MSISQNVGAVSAPASSRVTGPSVTALRWYMRIAGALLLLLVMMPDDSARSATLFDYVANHGPYIVPALAAIVGSFGSRANWLLGMVLTGMWAILTSIFIFGGPNGPGLAFEIVGAVMVGIGLVVAALSFRAFASDF